MNYQIRKVKVSDIRNYVELKHYSHNINGLKITVCYGLFEANTLKGAIIFGQLNDNSMEKIR